jgi:hypothetical protein
MKRPFSIAGYFVERASVTCKSTKYKYTKCKYTKFFLLVEAVRELVRITR